MSHHDDTAVDQTTPDPATPPPPLRTGRRATDHLVPPTTTAEQDRVTRSQRRINLIWELTQAGVTAAITSAEIYAQLHGLHSEMLNAAFFAVISTYLARTNHTKVGGVPAHYTGR